MSEPLTLQNRDKYCTTCGGEYGNEIHEDPDRHTCPFADDEPGWCGHCGAELMESGACDNDHSDGDDIT